MTTPPESDAAERPPPDYVSRKEQIVSAMLTGTTTWWAKNDEGRFHFMHSDCTDVFDAIFSQPRSGHTFYVTICSTVLTKEERLRIQIHNQTLFVLQRSFVDPDLILFFSFVNDWMGLGGVICANYAEVSTLWAAATLACRPMLAGFVSGKTAPRRPRLLGPHGIIRGFSLLGRFLWQNTAIRFRRKK